MITFDEAREIVKGMVDSLHTGWGTFYVPTEGWQDKDAYYLTPGAEEWLVDGDIAYMTTDLPGVLVSKKDGTATITTYLLVADRIDKMRPVTAQ